MQHLFDHFPRLRDGHLKKTSERDNQYNCIAWAAGENHVWWWPDKFSYWPPEIPRERTLSAFERAFGTLEYKKCNSHVLEHGYEKVAIYLDDRGLPTHAARQLPDGVWTSKCGRMEDIEHDLDGLEGSSYGTVGCILKRPLKPTE